MGIVRNNAGINQSSGALNNSASIRKLIEASYYYRHPDTATVAYAQLVDRPLGSFPRTKSFKIAIIGAGAAGITALYELHRAARCPVTGGFLSNIEITLYEPDPHSFLYAPSSTDYDRIGINKRAGRIYSVEIGEEYEKNNIVYEIGAMRFPEASGLTWRYVHDLFGDNVDVRRFPNPGTVPTEFVFGDRVDRYMGDYWHDPNSPTRRVSTIVREGLFGIETGPDISAFRIGCRDPAKIRLELMSQNTTPERLKAIRMEWIQFVNRYDSLTLGSAVKQIIKERVRNLATLDDDMDDDEEKINYYFELFGRFGFGTGGFRPMFTTGLIEMIRVLLWDYSNEYTLPGKSNVELIERMYEKVIRNSSGGPCSFDVKVKAARVCDVCHISLNDKGKKALVFSYDVHDNSGPPVEDIYDYVILAVPPEQLSAICSRAGFSGLPTMTKFGDYGKRCLAEISASPPLMLSDIYESSNSKMITAINQLNMISTSKVFGTIKKETFDRVAPIFETKTGFKGKIQAVVSDCGLASSYVIPSSSNYNNSRRNGLANQQVEYYSVLISYTWERDTRRLQNKFNTYPMNESNSDEINHGISSKHNEMIDSIINCSVRYIKDPDSCDAYREWWFGRLLGRDDDGNENLTHTLSYDWQTSICAGGFKVDPPGGHYNTSLCFRYHTHALNNKLANCFFIAGDSYSHLGGWIEGALMSAVNAVTGLIVAANGGGTKGLSALSSEAQVAIISLQQIAPTERNPKKSLKINGWSSAKEFI